MGTDLFILNKLPPFGNESYCVLMFSIFKRWNRRRILSKNRIAENVWWSVTKRTSSIRRLSAQDLDRLHDLASLFLYEKSIEAAHGFNITDTIRARIACEAALPVLNLGLEYYRTFHSIILYENAFYSRGVTHDEAGVLHIEPAAHAGEAWSHGPVILSWVDIIDSRPGHNVVIHEMAHKLDMLDGVANGRPPLQIGMDQQEWTAAFSEAFQDHVAQVEAGIETKIDAYAATNPAEFFAVTSEIFFEIPELLQAVWPRVYGQLVLYYRQGI